MKKIFLAITLFVVFHSAVAQQSFTIYNQQGEKKDIEDILHATKGKKFIFFGELHGQVKAHMLELVLLERLHEIYGEKLVLGMEMFEADVQPVIDEYFGNIINQKSFEGESRIWNNYKDYKPIVEFAKANKVQLVATNIPRRYANAVYHKGVNILNSTSDYAKQFFPSLPMQINMNLPSYQALQEMMPGHGGENMVASQAIKDATMAKYILLNSNEETVFYHLNGAYHSMDREGIISFMTQIPSSDILTITSILSSSFEADGPTSLTKADFTLIISEEEN